jgi:hypothetical protein
MTDTIECPTCGGSGWEGGFDHTSDANRRCPNCAYGWTATPEVLRRMKKAIHGEYSIGKPRSYADWDRFVLAVWLAEHNE